MQPNKHSHRRTVEKAESLNVWVDEGEEEEEEEPDLNCVKQQMPLTFDQQPRDLGGGYLQLQSRRLTLLLHTEDRSKGPHL